MTLQDLFSRIVPAIESSQVPYMLTGSVASSLHGNPRSTRDLDIVIAPTRQELDALVRRLLEMDYFADEQQAMTAFVRRSQFNVIDNVTGWKVDFIFQEDSDYGRTAFERRASTTIAGHKVMVSSPEDVLIAKLRWAKMSGSERQLQDASGILNTQGQQLDSDYVGHWVRQLYLEKEWDVAKSKQE